MTFYPEYRKASSSYMEAYNDILKFWDEYLSTIQSTREYINTHMASIQYIKEANSSEDQIEVNKYTDILNSFLYDTSINNETHKTKLFNSILPVMSKIFSNIYISTWK